MGPLILMVAADVLLHNICPHCVEITLGLCLNKYAPAFYSGIFYPVDIIVKQKLMQMLLLSAESAQQLRSTAEEDRRMCRIAWELGNIAMSSIQYSCGEI